MTESVLHTLLREKIVRWITKNHHEGFSIYSDSENNIYTKAYTPPINSFIPDVFATGNESKKVIIGEAKASQWDLDSEHSENQILAYLHYCSERTNAMLVLAVPVELINYAQSLLRALKRRNDLVSVETHVINLFFLD